MTLRRTVAALGCVAALALAGCGDDEGTTESVAPSTDATKATEAPAGASTTSTTELSTTEATVSTTEATVAPPPTDETTITTTTEPGGYDPDKRDAEDNDKPPEPGSPEEAFEEACEADAKACG